MEARTRARHVGFPFLLSIALVGCVKQPVVTIDHANVKGLDLDGIAVDVYLKVHNANTFDVKIRKVHADVVIAKQVPLPPVDLTPDVWVKSNDDTILPVSTKVPWTVVPIIMDKTLKANRVTFHFKGNADVTATRAFGIQEDHYPIEQDGELPREIFVKGGGSDGVKIQIGGGASFLLPEDRAETLCSPRGVYF